jgi:hypothetical protein
MTPSTITSTLPSTCEVIVPHPDSTIHDVTPRWSDAGISLPYAVVTPSNSNDIIQTINYAAANNLKIIPTSGGHGSFIPITDRTIYLPLSNFTPIVLDEEKQVVTIGGGCTTGAVLKNLAEKGWYTCTPNSNAVGIVGALLGGLNHSLVGLHGLGIDAVESLTVIPFSTSAGEDQVREMVLNKTSVGQEKRLFDALRGAGHGLGIITSVTLRAHQISNLNLTEGKVWTRRLIFPPKNLSLASKTYLALLASIPASLSAVLVFIRAPPTAPVPGSPMILLALSYFGPSSSAERVCSATFPEEVTSAAINASTVMTEWGTMNDGFEGLNRHGGFKEYHSAFVKSVDEESITKAFQAWVDYTGGELKGRGGSYVVFGGSNPDISMKMGAEEVAGSGSERYFSARDRGIFVQVSPWYADKDEKDKADAFGQSVVDAAREKDRREGLRDWSFANNFAKGQDVKSVYADAQIKAIKEVKSIWDKASVGWNPVADGW